MPKTKPINIAFLLFILYISVLFIISFIPSLGGLSQKSVNAGFELRLDYLLHGIAYFSIYLFYIATAFLKRPIFKKKALLWVTVIAVFLAILTEMVQLFVPYRTFNSVDVASNVAGIVLGLAMSLIIQVKAA